MPEQFCTSCGAPRSFADAFCPSCGIRYDVPQPAPVQPAVTPAPRPQYAPAYVHPQHLQTHTPPPPRRRRGRVVALGCVGVLAACSLTCALLFVFGGGGPAGVPLSADQERVAEEFGLPGVFSLACGEDADGALEGGDLETHRLEAWDYPEMGTRIIFRDGAVMGTRDIEVLSSSDFAYPAVSPASFSEGMTPDQVSEALGCEPDGEASLDAGLGEDVRVMIWSGVVSCTFADGELVAAETAPILAGEVAE